MMLMIRNYQVLRRYYKRLKMLRKLRASKGGLRKLGKLRRNNVACVVAHSTRAIFSRIVYGLT